MPYRHGRSTGALTGAVIGLVALGWIAGRYPAFQELVRNSEPNPEARLPYDWIAPLGAATGGVIGCLSGLAVSSRRLWPGW